MESGVHAPDTHSPITQLNFFLTCQMNMILLSPLKLRDAVHELGWPGSIQCTKHILTQQSFQVGGKLFEGHPASKHKRLDLNLILFSFLFFNPKVNIVFTIAVFHKCKRVEWIIDLCMGVISTSTVLVIKWVDMFKTFRTMTEYSVSTGCSCSDDGDTMM